MIEEFFAGDHLWLGVTFVDASSGDQVGNV
jgi:hypothetical protein